MLAKNCNIYSIVPVDTEKVGVMAAYSDPLCVCVVQYIYIHLHIYIVNYIHAQRVTYIYVVNYTHAQRVRICCNNTDLVHINGHDRIIVAIFSQALYKAP